MDQPVFFYPHAYLRGRHLDVIRGWAGPVLNPELACRPPDNVDRAQAVSETPARRRWRHRLWLPNLKRRPAGLPAEAVVYAFGAAVVSGPFITDLDNPYALVGYKVPALALYRPLLRGLLQSRGCVRVRCLSAACRAGLAEELGPGVGKRAEVAYPAMAPQVEAPEPTGAECRFLFVGSQFAIKGGLSLLRAFAGLRRTGVSARLDIVGHLTDAQLALAREIGGIAVHAADLPRAEIYARFYRHADVLVHPTFAESFGMAVLEAMAHGLAVIATDLYALPEMVRHGENGRLVRPPLSIWAGHRPTPYFSDLVGLARDAATVDDAAFVDTLARAMAELAGDAAFRARARAASLERVARLARTGRFEP